MRKLGSKPWASFPHLRTRRPPASRKLRRHAAGDASVRAGAPGSRRLRLGRRRLGEVGRRPRPRERWSLAAADYPHKKHS